MNNFISVSKSVQSFPLDSRGAADFYKALLSYQTFNRITIWMIII